MVRIDKTDGKIIGLLKENSRKPFLQIAKEIGVSEGTVRKRVLKLVKEGVIKRFSLELSNKASALIEVVTNSEVPTKKIVSQIKKLNIDRIFEVAGRYTILCMTNAESLTEINDVVESIRSIYGVIQTETFPILKED